MFTVQFTVNEHVIISQHCRATGRTATSVFLVCFDWICLKHSSTFVVILYWQSAEIGLLDCFSCQINPPLRFHWHLTGKFCTEDVQLLILQLSQALLQAPQVRISVFTLAAAGAALKELHLKRQLAEFKVLSFFPQVHTAAHRAILRAEGCRARHSQGVPMRNKRQDWG